MLRRSALTPHCVFALPHLAAAEWFVDLYAGAGFTDADDHTNRAPVFDLDVVVLDIAYKDSAMIGGRAGYWFDSVSFLGVGVDASHVFGPDIGALYILLRGVRPPVT